MTSATQPAALHKNLVDFLKETSYNADTRNKDF